MGDVRHIQFKSRGDREQANSRKRILPLPVAHRTVGYAQGGRQLPDATRTFNYRMNIHARMLARPTLTVHTENVGKTGARKKSSNYFCEMAVPRKTSSRRTGLGLRVYELRSERGMTQEELAANVGVKRGTITAIETGHDMPGRETLRALADVLGVTHEYLQEGTARRPRAPQSGEFVDDPDELAWLAFWRSLDDTQRGVMLQTLKALQPPKFGAA